MKRWPVVMVILVAMQVFGVARSAPPAVPLLTKKRDHFFAENNLVYSRFLRLARDGSYQQINREGTVAAEVDRGTWEQDPDGTVLLHYERGGLRFRALLAGPLSINLDPVPAPADLVAASATIRRWLAQTRDAAFAAASLRELTPASAVLTIDPQAESFHRTDLESILRQTDDFVTATRRQTFRFTLYKPGGTPWLLIQEDAVFQAANLPRVQSEYRVPPGQRPPFYFAQVDAETFAREAGSWQKLP